MRITLKLYATLTDYLPADSHNNQVEVEVAESDPVDSVLEGFHLPKRMVHLVLINGAYVPPAERPSRRLAAGDHLAVWPPIAGG
jgi:sulfur carrier protein ThiS